MEAVAYLTTGRTTGHFPSIINVTRIGGGGGGQSHRMRKPRRESFNDEEEDDDEVRE